MRYDLKDLDPQLTYKLMTATVTPRPIAWVTTLGDDGTVNAAPYSFFNVMGHTPPTLVLGLLRDAQRGFKDTAAHIMAGSQFVVNLVPESLAEAMNLTSMDAPRGISELTIAGLTPLPSQHIAVPQIAESPVSFECTAHSVVVTGPEQAIVIGLIHAIRIEDAFLTDAEHGYVDTPKLNLIGRMHGSGWYARSTDRFQMTRPSYADWKAEKAPAP